MYEFFFVAHMVENALNTTQNNGKSWMVLEMSRYVINSLPSVVHFFKTEGVAIAVICSIKTEHICHIYQDCNSGQTPSITNLLCQTITGDTSWCWHVRTPGKETSKSNTNTKHPVIHQWQVATRPRSAPFGRAAPGANCHPPLWRTACQILR